MEQDIINLKRENKLIKKKLQNYDEIFIKQFNNMNF